MSNVETPAQAPAEAGEPKKTEVAPQSPAAEIPKAPEGSAPVMPEKYELRLPEGSFLEASHLEDVSAYAKSMKLSQEQAQKVLERESLAASRYNERLLKAHEEEQKKWVAEIQNDKELGGEKFKRSIELSSRVIERFASPEFKKELDASGFGNHPGLIRFVNKIAQAMGEDQFIVPNVPSTPQRTPEEVFYPSQGK